MKIVGGLHQLLLFALILFNGELIFAADESPNSTPSNRSYNVLCDKYPER